MGAVSAVGVFGQMGLRGSMSWCYVGFVSAFACMCALVQRGLFLNVSGGFGRGLVGVLVRLVRWRRAWVFSVVCVSGRVGGVVYCAVAVASVYV